MPQTDLFLLQRYDKFYGATTNQIINYLNSLFLLKLPIEAHDIIHINIYISGGQKL